MRADNGCSGGVRTWTTYLTIAVSEAGVDKDGDVDVDTGTGKKKKPAA